MIGRRINIYSVAQTTGHLARQVEPHAGARAELATTLTGEAALEYSGEIFRWNTDAGVVDPDHRSLIVDFPND